MIARTLPRGFALLVCLLLVLARPAGAEESGFKPLFDGQTLTGWDADPKFWSVQDGAITGETKEPFKGPNTFCIYNVAEYGDFELKVEFRFHSGNSGIQYRSFRIPDKNPANAWRIGGYQADIDGGGFLGCNYGEQFRGMLAPRGQITQLHEPKEREVKKKVKDKEGKESEKTVMEKYSVTKVGDVPGHDKLMESLKFKVGEWAEYRIVAQGNNLKQYINDQLTCEVTDLDKVARPSGLIALQLHAGGPMKVQFRNLRIKGEPVPAASPTAAQPAVR